MLLRTLLLGGLLALAACAAPHHDMPMKDAIGITDFLRDGK